MDLLLFLAMSIIGGVALAVGILRLIYQAVDTAFDWLIYTFGNERAADEVAIRWKTRQKNTRV